jgi:hypothetical protein
MVLKYKLPLFQCVSRVLPTLVKSVGSSGLSLNFISCRRLEYVDLCLIYNLIALYLKTATSVTVVLGLWQGRQGGPLSHHVQKRYTPVFCLFSLLKYEAPHYAVFPSPCTSYLLGSNIPHHKRQEPVIYIRILIRVTESQKLITLLTISVNIYQTARCNIPEYSHLHTRRRENLKFHKLSYGMQLNCFWRHLHLRFAT